MKNITRIALTTTICVMFLFSIGCVSKTYFHTSSPVPVIVETSLFKISIKPIKIDSNFFSIFKVSIDNKSNSSLEIDWNKSRYIHDKKDDGVLIFKGIEPAAVKTATVPNSIVPANSNFTIEIAPFSKLSMGNLRDKTKDNRLKAGMLPEGENSVLLVLNQNKKVIKRVLSITIKEEVK
jgi:hypothetical protein